MSALSAVRRVFGRIGRPTVEGVGVGVLVGALVLVAGAGQDDQYEGRVGLLVVPAAAKADGTGEVAYGEVVALALPALVELARTPSVLQAAATATGTSTDDLAAHVAVELVPASGLTRLSLRGSSAEQAAAAVLAVARELMRADLLAPAGTLRLLDERPDVTRVAPDWALIWGMALVAAVVAGVATAALRSLRGTGADTRAVRAALASAGVHHRVATLREADPALHERLVALCTAAARPAQVVAVAPDLGKRARSMTRRLAEAGQGTAEGAAVVAMAHGGRRRQDELATVLSVLPTSSTLVAVVLA